MRLAKHRDTERVVAIKCLKKVDIRKNRQINSVLNECRSNQAMDHPFVNELLGRFFFVVLLVHHGVVFERKAREFQSYSLFHVCSSKVFRDI